MHMSAMKCGYSMCKDYSGQWCQRYGETRRSIARPKATWQQTRRMRQAQPATRPGCTLSLWALPLTEPRRIQIPNKRHLYSIYHIISYHRYAHRHMFYFKIVIVPNLCYLYVLFTCYCLIFWMYTFQVSKQNTTFDLPWGWWTTSSSWDCLGVWVLRALARWHGQPTIEFTGLDHSWQLTS